MSVVLQVAEMRGFSNENELEQAVAQPHPVGYIYPTGQPPRRTLLTAARRLFSAGQEHESWAMLMEWAARAIVLTGKSSRSKGQVGERELHKALSDELGFVVTRNRDQAHKGGADGLGVPGFALEIKRTEKLAKPAWWRQATRQAQEVGAEPLVFFRRSREPWQALIATADGGFRNATFEQAVFHLREKLSRLFGIYGSEK